MDDLPFSKQKQTGTRIMEVDEFKAWECRESALQRQCEEWLTIKNIPFIRIPDAVYKSIFANRNINPRLKRLVATFIRGLPDMTILRPDGQYNQALVIELKTKKGRLTQGQKDFAKGVNVSVIRSFEDFTATVEKFMRG